MSDCLTLDGASHRMGLAVLGMVGYGVFSVSNPATVDPPPQLPTVASPLDVQPKRPQGSSTN